MPIIKRPTPHYNARPHGTLIDLVAIHADAGKTDAGTIGWIGNPVSKVSYHYLIGRDARVYQFVPDEMRAWHAGVSVFEGEANCNDFSIGVSFCNDMAGELYPTGQIDAGVALVAMLCGKHGIPVSRITTHAAISPGRKQDPGPLFPWTPFLNRVGAVLP